MHQPDENCDLEHPDAALISDKPETTLFDTPLQCSYITYTWQMPMGFEGLSCTSIGKECLRYTKCLREEHHQLQNHQQLIAIITVFKQDNPKFPQQGI